MPEPKNVDVSEFCDHATSYLLGSDPIAICKHGRVIGFYIPVKRDEAEVQRAIDRLDETVERILEETGMTEEELATLFDLRRPFP